MKKAPTIVTDYMVRSPENRELCDQIVTAIGRNLDRSPEVQTHESGKLIRVIDGAVPIKDDSGYVRTGRGFTRAWG